MQLWKRNLFACWVGSFVTVAGMSMVVPFLPLYVELLGIHNLARIAQWSGATFGAAYVFAAIMSPIWGKLSDKHGRKLMLLRASLGMAIVITLTGFAQNIYQLLGLRLLIGLISGYLASAITLVASQTPKEHSGWALGTLSTGSVSGSLFGPLIGGCLADIIGLRQIFFVTGFFMFLCFITTSLLVYEDFIPTNCAPLTNREVWKMISNPTILIAIFITTFMVQFANFSIEPIITVYVKQLLPDLAHIALVSGIVVSASGISTVLAAPQIGKISDRIGPRRVLLACLILAGLAVIPQAFVKTPWQLTGLRFIMGFAIAGLLPSINSLIKCHVPNAVSGRIYGFNQASQYLGTIFGPIIGGQMAANFGIKYVFFTTSILLFLNAIWVYLSGNLRPDKSV
ncbi:MAG: multidrug efflux MFS transporter [Desulfitobacteriaceae bacterium]|nr:multidrug efflux MFS transporter [Desulfitobacteriaceae bacterium]MDD4401233.1 multidrug efflux MFS transporter [Desulfitobacteriaceae bacterium]